MAQHDLRLNNDVENGMHVRVHRYHRRKGIQVTIQVRKVGGTPKSISWFGWRREITHAWGTAKQLYAMIESTEVGS